MVLIVLVLMAATPVHSATPATVWFVQAGASGDGKSATSPTGSSATIERQSGEGDTIILLASDDALAGGLALKAGQNLIGVSESGRKPVINNGEAES